MESKAEGGSAAGLQEELSKYREELIKYKSAMEKALPKLKEQKAQLDATKQENALWSEKMKSLETKVANMVEERIVLNENTASMSNELAIMQQKFDEKTRELAAMQKISDEIESGHDAPKLTSSTNSISAPTVNRMQKIKQFLDSKTAECQAQAARLAELEKQVSHEVGKNKEIVDKSKELVKGLKDKLMSVTESLQEKNAKLEQQLSDATKKLESLEQLRASGNGGDEQRVRDLETEKTAVAEKLKESEKRAADIEAASKAVEADKKKAADEAKASTDAVKQLEARLREAEKRALDSGASVASELQLLRAESASQTEQLARDREYIEKSKALVKGLKEKARLATEAEVSAHLRLQSLTDECATLQSSAARLRDIEAEAGTLAQHIAKLRQWRLASLSIPAGPLNVKLRCADGSGMVWALIERQKTALEVEMEALVEQDSKSAGVPVGSDARTSSGSVVEWVCERADTISRISSEEALATVQEELQRQFDQERAFLLGQIEALHGEKETTQRAFDLFRDRAKGSLKKSAADQTEQTEKADRAERERAQLHEALQTERARAARIEAEAAALALQLQSSRSSLQRWAALGLQQVIALRKGTQGLQCEVADLTRLQGEALVDMGRVIGQQLSSSSAPDASDAVQRVEEASVRAAAAEAREVKLRAELKRRGDAAREMLAANEREISDLKSAVSAAAVSAAAPVSDAAPSRRPFASDASADTDAVEREQRLEYLKQAFCGLFKVHNDLDMKHMARVMCSILSVSHEEQASILMSIDMYHVVMRYAPAKGVVTTVDSITSNIASLFG